MQTACPVGPLRPWAAGRRGLRSEHTEALRPTAQDVANAKTREEIAARMAAEYGRVYAWAIELFGMDYRPSCRHFLLDRAEEERCRRTGERPTPAATVFTAKNAEGVKRHFVVEDGKPREVASYQEGFGDMLLAPDLGRTIGVRGRLVDDPRPPPTIRSGGSVHGPMTPTCPATNERGRMIQEFW